MTTLDINFESMLYQFIYTKIKNINLIIILAKHLNYWTLDTTHKSRIPKLDNSGFILKYTLKRENEKNSCFTRLVIEKISCH